MCTSDLVVTINFGEVSPLNTNSIVKVMVPIGIRSNQPYQVAVTMTGLTNANAQAVQASDVGFGYPEYACTGRRRQSLQSEHSHHSLALRQRSCQLLQQSERTAVSLTHPRLRICLVRLSILSGPELSKNNSSKRQQSDGYVFDAIFTLTPQFFAAGVSSATLIFTISPGPNVPC